MRALLITPEEHGSGFEDIMSLRTREYMRTLEGMRVEVLPISVETMARIEPSTFRRQLDTFRPDFTLSANFNYLLIGAARRSIFAALEEQQAPIIAAWDDPLGGVANALYYYWKSRGEERFARLPIARRALARVNRQWSRFPDWVRQRVRITAEERTNTLKHFRRFMRHPLVVHFAWDSGHIDALRRLDLVDPKRVHWYPIATYAPFIACGDRRGSSPEIRDLAFCGNLYPDTVERSDYWWDEHLGPIVREVCDAKLVALDRPVWSILTERLASLSPSRRRRWRLRLEDREFWDFYLFVVWKATTTEVRRHLLEQIDREVSIFGMFGESESQSHMDTWRNLRFEGNASHFEQLPEVFSSTRINLCISNGLIHQGMPSKLIDCLASGGFALCDPKRDLTRFFGSDVEPILFRNAEELNKKIDYFLAHPDERESITHSLRARVRSECTLERFFSRVLEVVSA